MQKRQLGFWEIWNMSFGFLGIQFGWGLQMANMSAIYEYLGASPDEIPLLWLAAPLTGFIIQPIIGYMSDRTWTPLGRRKPYFLVGAILASLALIAMPNSSALWMAAGLLWILDASINISMEPFRAFVSDMLPANQHTKGFAMQGLFIGLGAVIASSLPFVFSLFLSADVNPCGADSAAGAIPNSVKWSFYLGGAVFLGAVLYTIFKTKEYPPDPNEPVAKGNIADGFKEIFKGIFHMPDIMKKLALVQFFTWSGLFLMWFFFGVAITRSVFNYDDELGTYEKYHATYAKAVCEGNTDVTYDYISQYTQMPVAAENEKQEQPLSAEELAAKFGSVQSFDNAIKGNLNKRKQGTEWGGLCFSFYSLITFLFSLALPKLANAIGKRNTHLLCLSLGGVGLIMVQFITNKYALFVPMAMVGIAWTSILSMPYAMFASQVPKGSVGLYMGIFNFFIVIPEIIAALFFGKIMEHVLDNNRLAAVMVGGCLMLIAGLMCLRIKNVRDSELQNEAV